MKKVIRFSIIFLLAFPVLSFNRSPKEEVKWITVSELNEQYSKNPKPILWDIYTSWCGWCKEMDRTTYTNQKLVKYINEHYYAVKFDAESSKPVTFNNKQYGYDARNRSNELAIFLLFGQMQFPTTVFQSTIDAQPAPLPGYYTAKQMEAPLKFFGEGYHTKKTFVEFNQGFKGDW